MAGIRAIISNISFTLSRVSLLHVLLLRPKRCFLDTTNLLCLKLLSSYVDLQILCFVIGLQRFVKFFGSKLFLLLRRKLMTGRYAVREEKISVAIGSLGCLLPYYYPH